VLIAYVSAYGYTKQMAEAIAEGIREVAGYKVSLVDIENILPGELEEMIVKSKSILIGSPTINQNTLLPVYKMFALINPFATGAKRQQPLVHMDGAVKPLSSLRIILKP